MYRQGFESKKELTFTPKDRCRNIKPRAFKIANFDCSSGKTRWKCNPITGLDRPWGFQEVEVLRFQDNRHMKVVRLSAISTERCYPPGNIPVTYFW